MNSSQAVDQVNQAANATEWYLIAIFVITPIALVLISIPVLIIHQRRLRCPSCGFWRKNRVSGIQTIKTVDGNKASVNTQSLVVCRKCKTEFTI